MKEHDLYERAEQVEANGNSIAALLLICMKLESFGVGDLCTVVQSIFNEEEQDLTQKMFNSTDLWIQFDQERLPYIHEVLSHLTFTLKKRFAQFYGEEISKELRAYISGNPWSKMVEPRDVKPEFVAVAKFLL